MRKLETQKAEAEARAQEVEARVKVLEDRNTDHYEEIAAMEEEHCTARIHERETPKLHTLENDHGILLSGFASAIKLLHLNEDTRPSANALMRETLTRNGGLSVDATKKLRIENFEIWSGKKFGKN
jgi:hypothetical protein